MKAAMPPCFCASAMTWSARVVLPEDSGPKTSTTRPRGKPPTPRAASKESAPVEITEIGTMASFEPSRMIEPLPNCFSICANARSTALFRSSIAAMASPREFSNADYTLKSPKIANKKRSTSSTRQNQAFHAFQVVFRVYPNSIVNRLRDMNRDAIFQEAQLLQALAALQCGLRERAEAVERGLAIGIKAEMLEVADVASLVAVERNRRARKIECAALSVGDHFDRIGILNVMRGARCLDRPNIASGIFHQFDQSVDMIGMRERLVALHVDVNVGGNGLRDFVHAIGAAAVGCGGQARRPSVALTDRHDLVGIGGDDHVGECAASACSFIDALQHGLAGDLAQDLARQAGGGDARGNDGNNFHDGKEGGRLLQNRENVSRETLALQQVNRLAYIGHAEMLGQRGIALRHLFV